MKILVIDGQGGGLGRQVVHTPDGRVQSRHIAGKGGVVKPLIENTQIPGIVHGSFLLF